MRQCKQSGILIMGQIVIWMTALPVLAQSASSTPLDLRCEGLVNPLGIDTVQPRLSWRLEPTKPDGRGQQQTAYQIQVAGCRRLLEEDGADRWDSGRVESDQSLSVVYEGSPLASHQECWWKVRIWDEQQSVSAWSEPAMWSMGLLSDADWSGAAWIGRDEASNDGIEIADVKAAQWLWFPEGKPSHDAPVATRYFRRTLALPEGRRVARALAFFAGDDQCVMTVNGTQVGVGRGHPNLIGVDVTGNLGPGDNQLAVAATNAQADVPNNPGGWIGAVRVEFETGLPLVIHSDRQWRSATEATEGWEKIGFDDSTWVAAMELGQAGISPWGIPWGDRWHSEHRRLPARYVRHEFVTQEGKRIRRAIAYVCGLGFFDLYVNDQLIGDQLMQPALTGYDQRVLYVTFDITSALRAGKNALGVVLSNGRFFAPRSQTPMPMTTYGYPKLIAQVRCEYEDGSEQVLVSDSSWKLTTDGPLRTSSEFDGEEYDARQEMSGWAAPDFDDASWKPARLVTPPSGKLEAQMIEPIRVTQVLEPKQIIEAKPGIWMVDFGQAFYGVVRLKTSGPAGTAVSVRTSFNVLPDGTLNFLNDRSALNTDVYTLRGHGVEQWHPRFRGNATRWAQVEGFPGTPTKENFAGLVTHTDHQRVGEFTCSNPVVTRAYENARWGTRLQNRSVPMEPDRDERMPWSGHPAKTSESEGWVFNVARFYDHFLHNYRVHQGEDGSLQEILPPYWTFNSKDIIWPSVVTIIPDWYYNFYGDDRLVRDNYEMMKRFVLYHERTNLKADATLDFCTYGDWVDAASIGGNSRNFGATSRPLMGTAFFYHNCRIVQRAARLMGELEDERYFDALAQRVSDGFHRRFFDATTNTYESATQCSFVLPLAFGLVPAAHRDAVVRNLIHDITVTHDGHTSVGLIGMQWQMQVLTEIGHPETAYQIAQQTTRPSWGYMISKGATTSWERWDTDTQDGGMNGESQKILSGNLEAWCFQTLAGINYDPEQPGFKHIILRPHPVGDLTFVSASHQCLYGVIRSEWRTVSDSFLWSVTVPPNTTATLYVPTTEAASVRANGVSAAESPHVKMLGRERGRVVYQISPGSYQFESMLKR
ncbi:MAG: family 78 glycoside hydrolase catalytic domain [Pirellulaceae bacterium]